MILYMKWHNLTQKSQLLSKENTALFTVSNITPTPLSLNLKKKTFSLTTRSVREWPEWPGGTPRR